jgi:hypothetical protein
MPEQTRDCKLSVSTIFVFESQQFQTGANNVYEYVKAVSTANAARGVRTGYQFKSDFERMQYLIGLYGRTSQGLR